RVHEMKHPLAISIGQSYMLRKPFRPPAAATDHIAILDSGFYGGDFRLRDVIDCTVRNPVLDLSHLRKEPGVVFQVTGTPPVSAHLIKVAAAHRDGSKGTREVFDQSALLVVVNPIFQKMKSSSVFAIAAATPISIQFDHRKKILWGVGVSLYFQHSGK